MDKSPSCSSGGGPRRPDEQNQQNPAVPVQTQDVIGGN